MQETIERWSPWKVLAGTFILSAFPLLIVEMFPGQLKIVMAPAAYLVFHNIAEFFSIMVSLSMFGVGWFTYDQSKDRHALFLGTAFLAIGLMDFMHTTGMPAMPDFITSNLPNKSVQFWVAVRLFQGIAFLASAYVYAERPSRWLTKKVLMTSALLVALLVFTGITFFPTYMPTTFVAGVGLTPFKKISEYLVIGLLCAATVAYWRRMEKTGDRLLIYYLAAFVICIFSELVFAFYTRMFDTYNVLGHIYKVAAFSLIYYGMFKASVKAPYLRLTEVGEKLRRENAERKQTEEALRAEIIERKRLEDTLRDSENQVRFFASQCLTAQETERKRIAGELHDSIAASIAAVKFRIDNIAEEMKLGSGRPESLEDVASKMMEVNNEVRRIMADLRPSILDDLGIIPAIDWYCREYQKTYSHISVEKEIGISEGEVPDSLKTPIFRVSQEAMNNIAKYSKANHANLMLWKEDNKILLTIQDNGQGFNVEAVRKGMGLSTMRERAELSGGSFAIESTEGKGTTIRAAWPL